MSLVRLMAGVPTMVYGFTAVFILVPVVCDGLGGLTLRLSWLC
jgi:ABC-type phosphate transport system permease subunit